MEVLFEHKNSFSAVHRPHNFTFSRGAFQIVAVAYRGMVFRALKSKYFAIFLFLPLPQLMGRILAIDFGLKRTGIAVTDPLKIIASALITVPTHEVLAFLQKYCVEEEVDHFVLGLPLHRDGNPAQIAPQADAFAEKLEKLFPEKKVFRQDERNTSNDAKKIILQSGIKKQKRRDKALVDKIAAALILEQFMEENYWN